MSWDFKKIQEDIQEDFKSVVDEKTLESFRIKYVGKKGLISEIYASFPSLSSDEKAMVGKGANELKSIATKLIDERSVLLQSKTALSNRTSLDVTLPGVSRPIGHAHILTQTIHEICEIFEKLGFVIHDSPEIETEFNNFTALNIPVDHPSRDSFDTFYVDWPDQTNKGRKLLLRSQTSPGQIRVMQKYNPPFAVVIPGKVYRPDAVDASHSFMFHQIEGLLVDEAVRFSDLKGLLSAFCQKFFGSDIRMRFRPHFFPFTEPSAEVDVFWKAKDSWLEILGCGMVNPKVFDAVGYSKNKYRGLAFGLGVERMAMLKYGINDIRLFYENDVRFLNQF
ncbi:MAG: phenylalanine--tRNA ligase subunit alpha [Candidatus Omnitrophica bacterium]|nr:phenylalanine--tRNA ligase subunit alpha [Candidatus Omnitrophota bacterium]